MPSPSKISPPNPDGPPKKTNFPLAPPPSGTCMLAQISNEPSALTTARSVMLFALIVSVLFIARVIVQGIKAMEALPPNPRQAFRLQRRTSSHSASISCSATWVFPVDFPRRIFASFHRRCGSAQSRPAPSPACEKLLTKFLNSFASVKTGCISEVGRAIVLRRGRSNCC